MVRTDDDTWDITSGVGSTALGVALARAEETNACCPLFSDPYAQRFLDAAAALGWQVSAPMKERIRSIVDYAASRTRWFDDFFIRAGAHGITQAVILAAGLDSRGWRLPWVQDTVLYEIDQPKVLQFKTSTLADSGAGPAVSRYLDIAVDLRADWPKVLREAGFRPDRPTAWAAEGLLPYLPADAQDLLFERISALSATDSRVGVEAFGPGFFDGDYLQRRSEQMRELEQRAGQDPDEAEDVCELWYSEERADVGQWLAEHGWHVDAVAAGDLMQRLGRAADDTEDASPRTVFIEGVRL